MESAPFSLFLQVVPVKQERLCLVFSKIQVPEFTIRSIFALIFMSHLRNSRMSYPCPPELPAEKSAEVPRTFADTD